MCLGSLEQRRYASFIQHVSHYCLLGRMGGKVGTMQAHQWSQFAAPASVFALCQSPCCLAPLLFGKQQQHTCWEASVPALPHLASCFCLHLNISTVGQASQDSFSVTDLLLQYTIMSQETAGYILGQTFWLHGPYLSGEWGCSPAYHNDIMCNVL